MRYLTLLFALLLLHCKPKTTKTQDHNLSGNIVIIFNNMPENWKFSHNNISYSHMGKHELEYTQDNLVSHYYFSDYTETIDTLVIENVRHPIEILHKYKGHELLGYLANPMDTLVFTYKNKVPLLKKVNVSTNKYAYEYLIRTTVHKGELSSFTKHNLPFIFHSDEYGFLNDDEAYDKTLKEFKKKYFDLAQKELEKEKQILDSLSENKRINSQLYDYYNSRVNYHFKILKIIDKSSATFEDYNQEDELLAYSFYKDYLKTIVDNGLIKNIETVAGKGFSIPNPVAMYDSIAAHRHMTNGTKKYLSYVWLDRIINHSSNEVINQYFEQFKNQYINDTKLINFIETKYNLGVSVSDDLVLEDEHGHQTTFKALLENNKGRLLYVDFWASWCAPCRAVMPDAHLLKKKFQNKGVQFVYLALNDNLKQWQKAIQEEELTEHKENYFIINSKTSSMIDDLEIETLPRYIIYGRDNKILYKNAPAPNNPESEKLLNYLLIED